MNVPGNPECQTTTVIECPIIDRDKIGYDIRRKLCGKLHPYCLNWQTLTRRKNARCHQGGDTGRKMDAGVALLNHEACGGLDETNNSLELGPSN